MSRGGTSPRSPRKRGRGIKQDSGPRPKVVRIKELSSDRPVPLEPGERSNTASLPQMAPFEPDLVGQASELSESMADAFQDAARAASRMQGAGLTPHDQKLFQAFQSNLLSLISHELRTPLMGVQNALQAVEAEAPSSEWVAMAKRNVVRLSRTLQALIDLASIESGQFHARLREMDLFRFVSAQLRSYEKWLSDRKIYLAVGLIEEQGLRPSPPSEEVNLSPFLGDPAKMGRALELLMATVLTRAQEGSSLHVRVGAARVDLEFELEPRHRRLWEAAWTQAMAAHQSGTISPASAFGGTVQSEEAFLTRDEEGIGNEFILIHQILKLHEGEFQAERLDPTRMRVSLVLKELDSEQGLLKVLVSRLHEYAPEHGALGSVALGLMAVPQSESIEAFRKRVKAALYRASDAVYALPSRQQVAVVLNDCRAADVPRLMERLAQTLGGADLRFGAVAAPEDGTDPYALLELALKRMRGLGSL